MAAKITFTVQGARDLLHQEGEVYARIYGEITRDEEETTERDDQTSSETSLRHLMEGWSGFHLLTRDIRHSENKNEESHQEEEVYWRWSRYSTAEENLSAKTRHSPILLVEECGVPIEPKQMNIDNR